MLRLIDVTSIPSRRRDRRHARRRGMRDQGAARLAARAAAGIASCHRGAAGKHGACAGRVVARQSRSGRTQTVTQLRVPQRRAARRRRAAVRDRRSLRHAVLRLFARGARRRVPRVRLRVRRSSAPHLLRDEGELQPRRPRRVRAARQRLRHRVRRRACAGARGRRRPRQGRVLGRRQGGLRRWRRRSPRGFSASTSNRRRSLRVSTPIAGRIGQARAGELPREPRRRPQDPSVHRHRPKGEQVRRRLSRMRLRCTRTRRRCPTSRCMASTATSDRRSPSCRAYGRRRAKVMRPRGPARGRRRRARAISTWGAGLAFATATRSRSTRRSTLSRCAEALRGSRTHRLLFEPGRRLVGNAGVLLTRVEYLKPGRREELRDRRRGDERSAAAGALRRVASGRSGAPARRRRRGNGKSSVPSAKARDFLAHDRRLSLVPGDLLAVGAAGAYGMAMSSNYNTRPRACEVIVDDSRMHLVRRREQRRRALRARKSAALKVRREGRCDARRTRARCA